LSTLPTSINTSLSPRTRDIGTKNKDDTETVIKLAQIQKEGKKKEAVEKQQSNDDNCYFLLISGWQSPKGKRHWRIFDLLRDLLYAEEQDHKEE
jgi:hypothetical protein